MKNEPFTSVWHDAKEEKPKEGGLYFVKAQGNIYDIMEYNDRFNSFVVTNYADFHFCPITVDYWTETPPSPWEKTMQGWTIYDPASEVGLTTVKGVPLLEYVMNTILPRRQRVYEQLIVMELMRGVQGLEGSPADDCAEQ